jgi:hypothetical protein
MGSLDAMAAIKQKSPEKVSIVTYEILSESRLATNPRRVGYCMSRLSALVSFCVSEQVLVAL